MDEPNPAIKLCECGCGQPAPIAVSNSKRYGTIKGQPQRFVKGHNARSHLWPDGTPQSRSGQRRRTQFVEFGQRFERGVVVDPDLRIPQKGRPPGSALRGARLLCDCGNEYVTVIYRLLNGTSQSCGCLRLERQVAAVSKDSRPVGLVRMGRHGKPIKNLPQGAAPACACGCGEVVAWNQRKNGWNRYVTGHYRRAAPYKDEAWLREQYVTERRSLKEIATECGVNRNAVKNFVVRFGIPIRNASDAHAGRMLGPLNPAWKGGVADWDYSADWKVLARKIRDRDRWTCQDCGECRKRWGAALHVHHIDQNKLNNDPVNLISLCAGCHRKRHALLARGAA